MSVSPLSGWCSPRIGERALCSLSPSRLNDSIGTQRGQHLGDLIRVQCGSQAPGEHPHRRFGGTGAVQIAPSTGQSSIRVDDQNSFEGHQSHQVGLRCTIPADDAGADGFHGSAV